MWLRLSKASPVAPVCYFTESSVMRGAGGLHPVALNYSSLNLPPAAADRYVISLDLHSGGPNFAMYIYPLN